MRFGRSRDWSLRNRCIDLAKELGREIASQGAVLVTGATTGFPFWAAMGAKEAGGISIGISPAANEREHVETYKLPLDYMDLIIYTGFGYPGRDLLTYSQFGCCYFGLWTYRYNS